MVHKGSYGLTYNPYYSIIPYPVNRREQMEDLFDKRVLSYQVKELLMDIDSLLEDYLPKGKTLEDFTGGYVQQLKNSNQLVCYFGTKPDGKNRCTVKVTVEQDELDLCYMMLKAKIHSMRANGAKAVKVSIAQRRLDRLENSPIKKTIFDKEK